MIRSYDDEDFSEVMIPENEVEYTVDIKKIRYFADGNPEKKKNADPE